MNPIKTMAQFSHMLEQVLDELDELRASIEYDEEFMGDALVFLDPLEKDVRDLYAEVQKGEHQFGGEDLPFVERLKSVDARLIPFGQMLVWINDVHLNGLPEGE